MPRHFVSSVLHGRVLRRTSCFLEAMLLSIDFFADVVSPSSRLALAPEESESCKDKRQLNDHPQHWVADLEGSPTSEMAF